MLLLSSFLCAGFLHYGPWRVLTNRLLLYALLPFLVASMVLWTLLFHRFHLDGFHGGWHFPAVVSRLFLSILCLMCGMLATAYLAKRYVSRFGLVYFGLSLFFGFLFLRYLVYRLFRAKT